MRHWLAIAKPTLYFHGDNETHENYERMSEIQKLNQTDAIAEFLP